MVRALHQATRVVESLGAEAYASWRNMKREI